MKRTTTLLMLLTLALVANAQLVVTTTNIINTGCARGNGCPGGYCGFANFTSTNGWGFVPISGQTIYTATDTNHLNTKVESAGEFGDLNCDLHTVEVAVPTFSPAYRFTVFFTNKATMPTNGHYTLLLTNFTD